MFCDDLFCLTVTFVDDRLYFPVNLSRYQLTVILRMCQISADKYFIIVIIILDHTDLIRHTIPGHHPSGNLGGLLDIAGSSCGDVIKDNLLGNPSS